MDKVAHSVEEREAVRRPRLGRSAAAPGLSMVPRVFAVLAAVLLVGSVALASLLPADISLRQAVHDIDSAAANHVQQVVVGSLGRGFWDALVVPLLVRPVWMIPVCLGLICVGVAVTALSHGAPRTKQRRS